MKRNSLWDRFFGTDRGPSSADLAVDRLKVIIASDEHLKSRLTPDRIERMKREVLEVVNKYVSGVQIDDVNISHHQENSMDVLEMSINLPERHMLPKQA